VLDSSSDAEREFRLTRQDNNKEVSIDAVELSGNKSVIISFSEPLDFLTSYKLTIIALSDKDGNSIESGIDGIAIFSTPSSFENTQNLNLLGENLDEVLNSAPDGEEENNNQES